MEVFRSGGPKGCGAKPSVSSKSVSSVKPAADPEIVYYPDPVGVLPAQMRAREGIIVVVNPEPVPPIVVNQNIYGGDKTIAGNSEEESVSRQEFIEMMQIMREEIRVINDRLDQEKSERTVLKVQQIPLEPKQHVMEEIFEVNFDFDKAIIKPEYEEVIHKLAKDYPGKSQCKGFCGWTHRHHRFARLQLCTWWTQGKVCARHAG